MCYSELVQVVDVSNAEVEWGEEDDLISRNVGKNVEGDNHSAPDDLLADRTLNCVRGTRP